MAEEILAKIELVRSVVMERIGSLEAHIAELEAKVESGLDKSAILAALASLKAEALGIIPDELADEPETESLDVGAVEDAAPVEPIE